MVHVDDAGNIYVLDRKAIQIKVFDPQGKFIRAIGCHGQGPGEFQSIRYFQITPQKNILVLDAMQRRLTLFNLDGQLLREFPSGLWSLSVCRMDDNGDIIGIIIRIEQEASYELIRLNQNLEQVQTIARIVTMKMPVINPYFPNLIYELTPDGNVLWGTTTEYEFKVVNREGKTVKRIVKKYDPQIITAEDRAKKAKEMWGSENPPEGMKVEWPEYFPPIQDFILDDRGWLFVRPFVKEQKGKDVLYDVFDAEGRYVARVFLPAVARRIKAGKLYTIEEDAEGLLHVKRYTMEWK